jgi:hypothetical protein
MINLTIVHYVRHPPSPPQAGGDGVINFVEVDPYTYEADPRAVHVPGPCSSARRIHSGALTGGSPGDTTTLFAGERGAVVSFDTHSYRRHAPLYGEFFSRMSGVNIDRFWDYHLCGSDGNGRPATFTSLFDWDSRMDQESVVSTASCFETVDEGVRHTGRPTRTGTDAPSCQTTGGTLRPSRYVTEFFDGERGAWVSSPRHVPAASVAWRTTSLATVVRGGANYTRRVRQLHAPLAEFLGVESVERAAIETESCAANDACPTSHSSPALDGCTNPGEIGLSRRQDGSVEVTGKLSTHAVRVQYFENSGFFTPHFTVSHANLHSYRVAVQSDPRSSILTAHAAVSHSIVKIHVRELSTTRLAPNSSHPLGVISTRRAHVAAEGDGQGGNVSSTNARDFVSHNAAHLHVTLGPPLGGDDPAVARADATHQITLVLDMKTTNQVAVPRGFRDVYRTPGEGDDGQACGYEAYFFATHEPGYRDDSVPVMAVGEESQPGVGAHPHVRVLSAEVTQQGDVTIHSLIVFTGRVFRWRGCEEDVGSVTTRALSIEGAFSPGAKATLLYDMIRFDRLGANSTQESNITAVEHDPAEFVRGVIDTSADAAPSFVSVESFKVDLSRNGGTASPTPEPPCSCCTQERCAERCTRRGDRFWLGVGVGTGSVVVAAFVAALLIHALTWKSVLSLSDYGDDALRSVRVTPNYRQLFYI